MATKGTTNGAAPANAGGLDLRAGRKAKASFSSEADVRHRLPPRSQEAEAGVLGCVLLDPVACLGRCVEELKGGVDAFYDLRHAELYGELLEMHDKNLGVDVVTVTQRLRDRKALEDAGGLAYVAALPDQVPSAANLAYYLDIVAEKHSLRRMLATLRESEAAIFDHEGDAPALLDSIERDVMAVRAVRGEAKTPPVKELVRSALNRVEELHQRQGALGGLSTGLADLDWILDGMHPGELTVLGGFPSSGKTSLAMNIVEAVVLDQQLPVGVLSAEMTAEQLVLRMLCSRARVNLRDLTRRGTLCERDFPSLMGQSGKLAKSLLYLDDSSDMSVQQARAKARRWKQEHGIRFLVADYLQLFSSTGRNGKAHDNREQEIAAIAHGFKNAAKELGIPVLVLSQLNKEGKMRESQAIGQDADGVIVLETNPEDAADPTLTAVRVTAHVNKQRNGPTGPVNLLFLKQYTRFENAAREGSEQ